MTIRDQIIAAIGFRKDLLEGFNMILYWHRDRWISHQKGNAREACIESEDAVRGMISDWVMCAPDDRFHLDFDWLVDAVRVASDFKTNIELLAHLGKMGEETFDCMVCTAAMLDSVIEGAEI